VSRKRPEGEKKNYIANEWQQMNMSKDEVGKGPLAGISGGTPESLIQQYLLCLALKNALNISPMRGIELSLFVNLRVPKSHAEPWHSLMPGAMSPHRQLVTAGNILTLHHHGYLTLFWRVRIPL
jgi:hypothetical protein